METLSLSEYPSYDKYSPLVPVVRIASDRIIHRFIDSCPISPSGRYVALFRLPNEETEPEPGVTGEVVLVDLVSHAERVVATTRGWELQVGANVQWGATDEELFYNDVDTETWDAFGVRTNPVTGTSNRLEGTVFHVSAGGAWALSHNLRASRRAQRGYGVVVPDTHAPPNRGPVATDGVYVTNTETGSCGMVVSIRDIYEHAVPSIKVEDPDAFEYYLFTLKWNPAGTRLFTILQWAPPTRSDAPDQVRTRAKAIISMNADGSDIRTVVTPEEYAGGHHPMWTPDGDHITVNLRAPDGSLVVDRVRYDGSDRTTLFNPGSGHPSSNPRYPYIISDAYPREPLAGGDGTSPIRLLDLKRQRELTVARVDLCRTESDLEPDAFRSAFRLDAHPVWSRGGRYVVFNGLHENSRAVYLADLATMLEL